MSDVPGQRLLEALLDSWDRNNTILVNLLRMLPEGGLETRPMEGSPSVAELFTHMYGTTPCSRTTPHAESRLKTTVRSSRRCSGT